VPQVSDSNARAALAAVAQTRFRLKETVLPDHALFARVELADALDEAGRPDEATVVREEVFRIAPEAIDDSFEVVRRFSPHTPQYEVDANRLACEQALLCYGSVVPKIADARVAAGDGRE